MKQVLYILRFVYVAIALTPILIIFILKYKENIIIGFNNLCTCSAIIILSLYLSYFYIDFIKKSNKNTQCEQIQCSEVEVAEPKYIPIYIAYFVIAMSISDWITFWAIFSLIYLLILKGKFSFFNPYLLFCGYHFYEVSIEANKDKYAKYKVFLISKETIKNIKNCNDIIRLNDFTYLAKGDD